MPIDYKLDGRQIDIYFLFQPGPIQKIICDQLDLEYKSLKPKIKENSNYKFEKKKKYVCISVQSTAQMKYWSETGWNKIVRYLKELGYDIYVIDKYNIFGINGKWNHIPRCAIDETGDFPLDYRIQQIKNCEFFIGISSGLSWLAWALNKKVVLISGCTGEDNEFDCFRVINKNVCHGCLNDKSYDHIAGLKNWLYCPRNKNFECSRFISNENVKFYINELIKSLPPRP